MRGFQVGTAVGSTSDLEENFGFTPAGRFETLSTRRETNATARTFRYAYLPNSGLLQSLSIDGSHPFTVTRTYETQRNVLTALDTKWSATSQTKYTYTTDERGQRATAVQTGSVFADFGGADSGATFRLYTYNGRGELTGDIGYLGATTSDQTKPLNGRRHEFAYDTAGNRQSSNRTGVSDLRDDYTTNALNQYVTRENNTVPVSGTAEPESSPSGGAGGTAVAIEGRDAPAGRQGRYWNDDVVVNNNSPSAHPWRGPLTIYTAKRGTGGGADIFRMDVRMAQIAAILQDFTYDYDGNLTSDGLMDYAWDAENRLVRMETTSVAQGYNFPHWLIEFRYDYMGRRVQKRVLDAGPSPAVEISCRRYLYDGWSLIAEYNATGGSLGSLVRSYTWGLDIAVSLSDAGGVGALLQIADHPSGRTYLPTYDGNGNIVSLLNADSGAVAAAYEYSAFGEPLRAQTFDPFIADNPFRFSSKYTDLETGLVYYGHRYYDPRNGRFINRDPIEEAGGFNLYGFCGNDGVNKWDRLGMTPPPATNATGITAPNGESTSQTMYLREGQFGVGYYSTAAPTSDWSATKDGNGNDGGEFFGNDIDAINAASAEAERQRWDDIINWSPTRTPTKSAPNRAGTSTSPTGGPVQTVVIPGQGTLVINKYDGGAGKNGSQLTLDFDFNHSGGKDAYGVLQTVTTDTFQKIKTPYADPINGPKYYTDGITMVPRPDPSSPVYDLKTGTMIPGFQMLPSTGNGVLRFQDSPTNPVSSTPLYGTLGFQTVIVTRPSDTPVVTITWGYSNQSSGFVKQPIVITPAPGP